MIKTVLIIYIVGVIVVFIAGCAAAAIDVKEKNSLFKMTVYRVDVIGVFLKSLMWPVRIVGAIIVTMVEYKWSEEK